MQISTEKENAFNLIPRRLAGNASVHGLGNLFLCILFDRKGMIIFVRVLGF